MLAPISAARRCSATTMPFWAAVGGSVAARGPLATTMAAIAALAAPINLDTVLRCCPAVMPPSEAGTLAHRPIRRKRARPTAALRQLPAAGPGATLGPCSEPVHAI